jgi:hypothetical protein
MRIHRKRRGVVVLCYFDNKGYEHKESGDVQIIYTSNPLNSLSLKYI